MKSSLIEIKNGDPVIYENRRMNVVKIVIAPNGMSNPQLIALIYAKDEIGMVQATADKFLPCEDYEYTELYPSVLLNRI